MDPYALLGVEPGADEREVRKAYRRAVRRLHPDLQPVHLREQSGRGLQAVNAARNQVLEELRRDTAPVSEPVPEQRRPPSPTHDGYGDAATWAARQAWLVQQQRHIDDWNASRAARAEQRRRESERRHHRVTLAGSVRGLATLLVVVAVLAGVLVGAVRGAEAAMAAGARLQPISRPHADLDLQQVLALFDSWRS
jgi:hypothetical protein